LAIESQTRLNNVAEWMNELRRNLQILISTIRQLFNEENGDENNIRTEISELFDPVLALLRGSVTYLQRYYTGMYDNHEFDTV